VKKLNIVMVVVVVGLVVSIVVGILSFAGNVDEWGATLESISPKVRPLAEELRAAATRNMQPNPDGYYRYEAPGRSRLRYYLVWRIWTDAQKTPAYLESAIGDSNRSVSVEAVGEAMSASASILSWDTKFDNRVAVWFEKLGTDEVHLDVFIRVNGTWRPAGALPEGTATEAMGEEDRAAAGQGRFNRIVLGE